MHGEHLVENFRQKTGIIRRMHQLNANDESLDSPSITRNNRAERM